MTQLFLLLVIGAGVLGYLYYMKKSGKLGNLQQNYVDAEEDIEANFETYLEGFKKDPDTFKPIVDIIGSDFISLAICKKPKDILGAAADTAKTMITGVVVENTNIHTIVLAQNKLHYIEYNPEIKKSREHWIFEKENISDFVFGKGKLSDNLKQSMSFQLKDGGESGDTKKNSDMKKLSFSSKDKKYEFFIYDLVGFGKGLQPEKRIGGMGMSESKEDIIKSRLHSKIAQKFFDNIIKF